ncbi:MAG: surface lipoprotein assembly modifier [bacterium]
MQKLLKILWTLLLILFLLPHPSTAKEKKTTSRRESPSKNDITPQANKARSFYDLGVFAYEGDNYQEAEGYLKEAVKMDSNNPFYNHYLGKVYLKLESFQTAKDYLNRALKINPKIPELKYDLAFTNYKMDNYPIAANLFLEIIKEDPTNIMAYYYAGINLYELKQYKKALKYFIHAAHESSSIKTNGYYYIGICYMKTGKIKEAIEKLEYVANHAASGPLRENALEWIKEAKMQDGTSKPYSIFLKIGYKYDDNIRFEVEDLDIHTEEDAYFYFSGCYNIFNTQSYRIDAGYSHYQTWGFDSDEYGLTGSILNLYAAYRFPLFTFRFGYLPCYYWLDSDSYLMRHQLRPEIIRRINRDLIARLSFSYYNNEYFQYNEKDGHTNEIFLDTYYTILKEKGNICAGAGYAYNDSSHPDYRYNQLKTKLGLSLKIPWELNLCVTAYYYNKGFCHDNSLLGFKRDDDRYYGSIAFSRNIFYPWLDVIAGFSYTKNDSNIDEYEYKRRTASLSLAASY